MEIIRKIKIFQRIETIYNKKHPDKNDFYSKILEISQVRDIKRGQIIQHMGQKL